jgi:uncharacterized protein
MKKHQFKILSIDGGGIRGIIPCRILSFIEQQLGNNLSTYFDLMAGTSTGGIITLGLTKPNELGANAFTAKEMLELYTDHGGDIFGKRKRNNLSKFLGFFNDTAGELTQEVFVAKGLEDLLEKKLVQLN